jgi:hypothetical protein
VIIKLKRKKYALICLLLAVAFVSGCAQKHKEGEPDVISSMKMNQDETLTVVANRKQIEDKEDFAKLLVKKCKENSFQSVRFSTDYGYATSLNLRVYLWIDYEITREELEECHTLCHGNWIEIEHKYKYIQELRRLLDEHGIPYPEEYEID